MRNEFRQAEQRHNETIYREQLERAAVNTERMRNACDLFTVAQAAETLHLSVSAIRSYMRVGRLKAYRVAGKRVILIPRSEICRLLEPLDAKKP